MASLDSAKGPSATVRPFLPDTILPSCSRGWPALTFPCWVNRSNQAMNWPVTFWISSGERPLSQCVPRNNSMYSVFVSLLIVYHFVRRTPGRFKDTTKGRAFSGQSFCIFVLFPQGEHVLLGVLTEDEVTHLRHRGLGHHDLAAEFLDLCGRFIHRSDGDVIRNALMLGVLAFQQSAIGRVVAATRVNMPVFGQLFGRTWKPLDFPTEQGAVKRFRTFDIVRRDFKPHDAGRDVAAFFMICFGL